MGGIGSGVLILLYRSLASSIAAGLSPLRALEILAGSGPGLLSGLTSSGRMRSVAAEMLSAMRSGGTLSEAMRRHPEFFAPWQVEMVLVGEATGRLDRSFHELADTLEEGRRFILSLVPGLLYPALLLHFAPVAFCAPTLFHRGTQAFAVEVFTFLAKFYIPVLLAWLVWVYALKDSAVGRHLPVLNSWRKANFCFYLSSLVKAGVSFPRALELAGAAAGFGEAGVSQASGSLGLGVAERLRSMNLFTQDEMAQLEVSELSGKVDEGLAQIASMSRTRWQAALKSLTAILPAMTYLAIAGVVAYRIISFWSGMYSRLGSF